MMATTNDKPNRRAPILSSLLVAILLAGGALAIWWVLHDRANEGNNGGAGKGPVTPPVEETVGDEDVEQFYVGVATLDIGENQRAEEIFKGLADRLSQEPAVWADLALARLRLNDLEPARQALETAVGLAPDNQQILILQAVVDERSGEFDQAIDTLKGIHNPDPQALYMWAQLIERTGRDDSVRERLELINRILEQLPTNLVARFDQARLAARMENAAQLKQALEVIGRNRGGWNEQAVQFFEKALADADAGRFREAANNTTFLQNLTKPNPQYQASLAPLRAATEMTGTPVRKFVVLPSPTVVVAEPDAGLSFVAEAKSTDAVRPDLFLAFPFSGERRSTLLSLAGDTLQVGTTVALHFSPPANAGPGVHCIDEADVNADFREDLLLIGPEGLAIYLRNENGNFTPFAPTDEDRPAFESSGQGVWTLDFDADGDLDILIAGDDGTSRVLRNNGDMTFAAVDALQDLPAPRQLCWCDLDEDGDDDLTVLDRNSTVHVLLNERAGNYVEVDLPADATSGVAVSAGDVNRDGAFDVVELDDSGTFRRLTFDDAGGEWSSAELLHWDDAPGLRDAFSQQRVSLWLADVDNNGAIDVIASAGAGAAVWLGDQDGAFQLLTPSPELLVTSVSDVNGDGRLDLCGLTAANSQVAVNHGTKDYHWQWIEPRANPRAGDKRINTFGVGGRIEIFSGRLAQAAPITSSRVHFGLGTHERTGMARIVWPNGTIQAEFELAADRASPAQQRLSTSCPFVFARNHDGLHFVKDFIWRSPLGLKINSQDTAGVNQTEDWIKVPGDLLTPTDGVCEVRITADLWETHFFDLVSLLVVDHPQTCDVFVDERFIANRSPALQVRAFSPPRALYQTTDEAGHDVSAALSAVDGIYVDSFPLGTFQGVADEHWIEFELDSELPTDKPLFLVGEGWIYPTDSSLNVAMSQGDFPRPHGLILEVPAADGMWRAVSDDLGFPAGKNKTALIPLPADLLQAGQRRFRLRTNLEVYWDYLGWSTAEPDSNMATTPAATSRAELRHRGFSELTPPDRRKPDLPIYERLATVGPRWFDLEGYYTRYGDVQELLESVDDRYVIMNAGDELVLQFAAPEPPPDGWSRDYVLIGDGWVKDGNLNTSFSQTVHPLPSHGVPDYGGPAGDFFDDPVYQQHRDDWQRYHTRYVTPQALRRDFRSYAEPRPARGE